MRMVEIGILKDETAQTAAEYLMILGGIIVIVLVAMISYQNYIQGLGSSISDGSEVQSVENTLQDINQSLTQ